MRNNSTLQGAEEKKKKFIIQTYHYSLSDDIEYSINSNFLKSISSKLYDAEISLMSRSNNLLDSLANYKIKDMQTTIDTVSLNQLPTQIQHKSNRFQRDRKLFSRKSPKNMPIQISFQYMLRQIEQNCSKSTINQVKRLISEIKILKKAATQLQGIQRKVQSKTKIIHKLEQQNLTQDIEYFRLNKKLQKQKTEIRKIQQQLKDLNSKQKKQENEKVFTQKMNLKLYIEDKQRLIQTKMEKLVKIQQKIQKCFMKPLQFGLQCSKCCTVLKKLKQSINQYRLNLNQQGKQMDNLFNRYKNSIFTI